ncbi:hypothetical protein GCM10009716_17790 [Streptomyces sodiiphilus]|uniref:YcaO domain-containing protein n=1 Tax=Streptomyces sodiiphilus TaxID=226217 RepID=A0ABN2P3Q3_9ACTN
MPAAFDRLAGTRPRISRDVLFTQSPGGVLFHNADGGFLLRGRTAYRFASLIVPHLDGSHRLSDICTGFGEQQRAMVAHLVGSLYEKGFARDAGPDDGEETGGPGLPEAVAGRFAAQIAYIDHYGDDAGRRFAAYRNTSVAVLGEGETARWAVLSLVRNGCARITAEGAAPQAVAEAAELAEAGCPVELDVPEAGRRELPGTAGFDVLLVAGDDAGPRTHRLLGAGLAEGQVVIPVWTFGSRVVAGPLSRAGGTGCWSCAVLRFGDTTDAGAAAELWSRIAGSARPGPATGAERVRGPLAAMMGNLLGFEAFRVAAGVQRAETDGHVIVQDIESLDVVAEPLHPHPRCRSCVSGAAGDVLPDEPVVARSTEVATARDAEDLVARLNGLSQSLVRERTGVISRWDDEVLTQTPLKIARLEMPLGRAGRRTLSAFDVHHLAGARLRALRAAACVYATHMVPPGTVPGGAGQEEQALVPAALTCDGGTGAAREDIAAWVRAVSLLTKEPVLVPAAAVHPAGEHNRERLVQAGGAGAGAGESPQEAAGDGLLSALAHDALMRAVRGGGRVRLLEAGDDAELVFLRKSARNLELDAELLDLGEGEHSGAHVVLARETAPADGGAGAGRWAVGCALTRRAAAASALRDLLGQVQLAAETGEVADTGDPLVVAFEPGTVRAGDGTLPEAGDPAGETSGAGESFGPVLERLRAAGRDVLHVATTPADLLAGGVHTARVLLTRGER